MSAVLEVRSVSLELAQVGLKQAMATSISMQCLTCTAVVDNAGHLIAFARMDGAPFQSSRLAEHKAISVAGNGRATHEFWEMIKDEPWLVHNVGKIEGLVVLGGGVPIIHRGQVIGAVGVSGRSTMDQDRAIAEAAAEAIIATVG